MTQQDNEIVYKHLEEMLVLYDHRNVRDRRALLEVVDKFKQNIPTEIVAGDVFCIFQFITSYKDGFDLEVCFPVSQVLEVGEIKAKTIPSMDVLSLVYKKGQGDFSDSIRRLFGFASLHGLISDEFYREIYIDWGENGMDTVEIQFVIHSWTGLLAKNLKRELDTQAMDRVMRGCESLEVFSTLDQRFDWVRGAIERLEDVADENQRYRVLSGCSHIFPPGQLAKLRAVYVNTLNDSGSIEQAVDAVIDFMNEDPGWGERPRREGNVIFSRKKPRDMVGYESAENDSEKRKAYCFCPIIRERVDRGMPVSFCYCGAGWYRQQWEAAIGKPVTVEILQSILKGDLVCEFAITLPM